MEKIDVLFIDPPMKVFKDNSMLYGNLYQPEDEHCKVFNPGILSIASYILSKGYKVKVVHIFRENDIESKLAEIKNKYAPAIIAVSCSYMHTYLPTVLISNILNEYFPKALLIGGGRHIGDIAGIALKETKFDLIIRGEGEKVFERILSALAGNDDWNSIGNLYFRRDIVKIIPSINLDLFDNTRIIDFVDSVSQTSYIDEDVFNSKVNEPLIDLNDMPFIHYELYENYKEYPPYLEESRGCYAKCKYCVDSTCSTYRYKRAGRFLDELDYVIELYGRDNIIPFTAANFGVNVENTIKICEGIIEKYGAIRWIAEFRLDLKWDKYIDLMYKSGCKVFNVGLESASPEILKLMNKTRTPKQYLESAERLINKVISFGDAFVHLNFMFYFGESPGSMADNMGFISKHYKDIAIVHYSPLILYSNTEIWNNFKYYHDNYGASIVKNNVYDRLHAYPVNVSRLYGYHEGCIFSRMVEKMFVNTAGYMVNHETRLARNSDGSIDDEAKEGYIKRMLKTD